MCTARFFSCASPLVISPLPFGFGFFPEEQRIWMKGEETKERWGGLPFRTSGHCISSPILWDPL